MAVPTSTVDSRFSMPGATATPWEQTEQVLSAAPLFWISTVRRDGRPHVTPLVAVWDDGALYFSTGEQEQKALNLAANPDVVLTTGANGWEDGLDVMVEGPAVPVLERAALIRIAERWAGKWDGRWEYEVGDGCLRHPGATGRVLVFAVSPTKVLAFAKGEFSHTSHRFS
jgi:general stress protein 26